MTKKEFTSLLQPLALSRKVKLDVPGWKLLYEALSDLPDALLRAAVLRASRTRKWFPNEAELREDAEACRLELRAAAKWAPCALCEADHGWVTVTEANVQRLMRCECWKAHQARLAELGATNQPLALPAADTRALARIGDVE